jgi:hypothetical protein
MAFDCVHPKIIRPEKTWGHHPGLDDGPESRLSPARPPSLAREIRQRPGNNSYNGKVYPKAARAAEGLIVDEGEMQDARCKMQDARCKMQDARCKMQDNPSPSS